MQWYDCRINRDTVAEILKTLLFQEKQVRVRTWSWRLVLRPRASCSCGQVSESSSDSEFSHSIILFTANGSFRVTEIFAKIKSNFLNSYSYIVWHVLRCKIFHFAYKNELDFTAAGVKSTQEYFFKSGIGVFLIWSETFFLLETKTRCITEWKKSITPLTHSALATVPSGLFLHQEPQV